VKNKTDRRKRVWAQYLELTAAAEPGSWCRIKNTTLWSRASSDSLCV